jgi:lipoprotein-anchoring transpeptidase ErfK/SrfK
LLLQVKRVARGYQPGNIRLSINGSASIDVLCFSSDGFCVWERVMLRIGAFALVFFALFPSISAMAEADKPSVEVKTVATISVTQTRSGTTTYFGQSAGEAAKAAPRPLPEPTLIASVDLASQKMVVSIHGEVRYSWPISSGVAAYPTPTGTFRPEWTSKMWYSRKYDMAPMPHAVFINGGVAVHGTYHTAALGSPASHGCIRLSTANAKTFYNLVQRHGLQLTKVSVYGRPNWRNSGAIASASRSAPRKNTEVASEGFSFWDTWGFGSAYSDAPRSQKAKSGKKNAAADDGGKKAQRRKSGKVYGYGYGGTSSSY